MPDLPPGGAPPRRPNHPDIPGKRGRETPSTEKNVRERLNYPILINVTAPMFCRWRVAARRSGKTLSAWLREAGEAKSWAEMPEGHAFPLDDLSPEAEACRREQRERGLS
jgi:hypothetical protein